MAGMYPDNQELVVGGEPVIWPGVDKNGKFTNGDFNNPLIPPSFIPAETMNLLLDNLGGVITMLGGTPNNRDANQISAALNVFIQNLREERDSAINRAMGDRSISFPYGKERFVTFDFADDNHRSVKIKKDVHIRLDIPNEQGVEHRWFETKEDTILNLSEMMQEAASASSTRKGHVDGRQFYAYLVPDEDTGTKIVISCNSTYPNDVSEKYTGANTRKIFEFATLCANAGSNLQAKVAEMPSCGLISGSRVLVKNYDSSDEDGFYDFYNCEVKSVKGGTYFDVVTCDHPLAGFLSGEILPESIFCITFQPYSSANGMVYDVDTDMAYDIYLQSGKGSATTSEFGATITDTRHHQNHQDDMRHVKKRLLYDHEFSSMAAGSNEGTAIKGAADPVTTGGHIDTAGRAMISFIGVQDACGVLWQWLECVSANGGSGWATYDGQADLGQTYGGSYALLAGAPWSDSSSCGSRARHGTHSRATTDANFAGRGASHIVRST